MGLGDSRHTPSGITGPLPEDAAIANIALYSETYNLVIKAAGGQWTVQEQDVPGAEPAEVASSYTGLMTYLRLTYGTPGRECR